MIHAIVIGLLLYFAVSLCVAALLCVFRSPTERDDNEE